jgi:hypothetical protein
VGDGGNNRTTPSTHIHGCWILPEDPAVCWREGDGVGGLAKIRRQKIAGRSSSRTDEAMADPATVVPPHADADGAAIEAVSVGSLSNWLDGVHPGYGNLFLSGFVDFGVDCIEKAKDELELHDIGVRIGPCSPSSPSCQHA